MRDPIENVTRLQKQLNNLQLENQVLKNILDKAGLSYQNELASIGKKDTKEDFDPEQGKRIVYPKEITDRMAKLFFSFFWGRTDVYAKRNVNKNGEAAYWMQLHEDMRQAGFYIKTVEESCERFAVIDQEVVWYGNYIWR